MIAATKIAIASPIFHQKAGGMCFSLSIAGGGAAASRQMLILRV